jgi:neurocan core protein
VSPLAVAGEPSAPKLEGQMGEDGNSIKVNLIKQDDGGSPIRHYLVKYRAVSGLLSQTLRDPASLTPPL